MSTWDQFADAVIEATKAGHNDALKLEAHLGTENATHAMLHVVPELRDQRRIVMDGRLPCGALKWKLPS